jgi:DNA-binding LacI/PurR family transcriptional regulator
MMGVSKMDQQRLKRRRATRQEVADHAKVSVAVVSYVVNNGPRPVATETRSRVEQSIKELGYYPNEFARNLRKQNSSTIGLIIPSITNAVYAEIAEGLDSLCVANGYQLLLLDSHNDTKREKRLVHLLRSKQVDGVVMQPKDDPKVLIKPLRDAHIPVVLIDHAVSNIHCITLSDFEGGRLATEHLLELGHTRIAIIREKPGKSLSYQRFEGYQQALATYHIAFDPNLVVEIEAITLEAGHTAMRHLLRLASPPTAVFTHNDILALSVMHAVDEAGLSVPKDISVVGYDDISSAAYLSPPLTTVRLAKHELGQEAGRIILEQIKGMTATSPRTVTLPVELIVRASTVKPT